MIKTGQVEFLETDPIFKEHFPNNAVVPGSFLIEFFINKIQELFAIEDCSVKSFRFNKFLQVQTYDWEITKKDEDNILCIIKKDSIIYAKGKILVV